MEHASRAVPKERAGRNLGLNPAVTEAKVLVGATSRPLRGCPCASMLLMILQRCIMVCAGQRPDQVGSSPTDARVRGVISKSGGNASLAGVS